MEKSILLFLLVSRVLSPRLWCHSELWMDDSKEMHHWWACLQFLNKAVTKYKTTKTHKKKQRALCELARSALRCTCLKLERALSTQHRSHVQSLIWDGSRSDDCVSSPRNILERMTQHARGWFAAVTGQHANTASSRMRNGLFPSHYGFVSARA